jgi:hypothetical protein
MEIILEAACIGMGKAVYFIIADLGAIVFLKWGYPLIRQKVGEREIRIILSRLPNRYRTTSGLMLKVANEAIQIDHVVASPDGVFIIMTKHHEGAISGNGKDQYWTHTMNKKKTRFYNPVWQNHSNMLAVKKLLKDYPDSVYSSIVAFSRRADVSDVSSETPVVYFDELPDEILKKRRDEPLTGVQVDNITMALERRNIKNKAQRRKYSRRNARDWKEDPERNETLNFHVI